MSQSNIKGRKTDKLSILKTAVMLTFAATLSLAEQSEDGLKRLGIQVRDGEPGTFTKVVNVVVNFA
jgi:hypothetical protein